MTSPPPLLLRLEPEISEELRLALGQGPGELPSDDVLVALRARLAEQVGAPVRLRDRAALGRGALRTALRDEPGEFPNGEQLRVLARQIERKSRASRGVRAARRMRPAVLAACLLIACVAAAASYWVSRHRERPVPPPSAPASASGEHAILREPAVEPAPPSPSPEPSATPESDAGARSSPTRPKALPSVAAEGPSELELLREAQRLQASDPAAALVVVARHLRLFPSGILAQEREMVAIDALMRLGHGEAARARAATFLRRYPGSVHALRIRELVGGSAPSSSARAVEPAAGGSSAIFSP